MDDEDNYWKCPHCGHDESWFDRSIYYWQDKDGKHHEEGPFTRCCSCGKTDESTELKHGL
jgi:uncharacterized Zn finger protein